MNRLEWDLHDIFEDNKIFYDEMDYIKELIVEIKKYEDIELDSKLLLELLDKKYLIKKLTNNVLIYGSLMYYKNVKDDECIKLKKDAEEFNGEVDTVLKFIDRKIIELGFDSIFAFVQENPMLNVYKLFLSNLFRIQEHIQSDDINQKIKENNVYISEKIGLYNNLLRDIKYGTINIDGKEVEVNSSNYAKYISSRDREVRCQTYYVVNEAFYSEKEKFADLLNKIYGYRTKNAFLEKYGSVLEKVLFEENINPVIIEKLIDIVNSNLYLIQRYLKMKSDLLGIDEPYLYDFNVPLDSSLKIKYSLEEAKEIILNALKPLGDEYIEVVKLLFNGHIDAELDNNKHQSITFSWHTYSFMNFRGAYVDLKNLVHEIGHIVNYYLSMNKQPFIYEDSTVFVGETASIVNEILLSRYLYQNAESEEERIFYLSKEIENYFTSVFKQTMYTEFENEMYSLKTRVELTSDVLCDRYSNIIKKYYGDDVIYDDVSSIEWARLGHLYRWSYYPYKYATGLLIASVVVDSLVDKKILSKEDYFRFLSAGSSEYSLDLLKRLNIDLLDSDIMSTGFNVLKEDIDELGKILTLSKN